MHVSYLSCAYHKLFLASGILSCLIMAGRREGGITTGRRGGGGVGSVFLRIVSVNKYEFSTQGELLEIYL